MADGIATMKEVKLCRDTLIPKLELELGDESLSDSVRLSKYNIYKSMLQIVARFDFATFNKYLELDEDHTDTTKAFYHHRKGCIGEIVTALNDMEVYDKYDLCLISTPPRVGKTTLNLRFQAFILGRHPEKTELVVSYSDNITTSFYAGVLEIVNSVKFSEIFPDCPIVQQNAKQESIWLKALKRYPSITFAPIGGSLTGRCEAGKYLFCDDLVSGFEEAVSRVRMDKLWDLYTVNCKQRKLDGAKEVHIATKWSVHDPMCRLAELNKDNPRCKIILIPCYDENGESNFNFKGGFSTEYYKELEASMDKFSFGALYKCEAIEREGILYNEEDLQYYFELPNETPDTIISICDSKNLGVDNVSSLVGYVYGEQVYIEDVIFDNRLPDITRPRVANMLLNHKVVRCDVELNNGGNYYAEDLDNLIRNGGGKTSMRIFYSGNNKNVKIITYSDFAKSNFVFKHKSLYTTSSDYGRFMKDLYSWTQSGKNKHDDAPDAVAMLSQLFQDLTGMSFKILDRRKLRL